MLHKDSKSPIDDSAASLGFKRQPMVDWFSPTQLAQTGLRAVISSIFGSYADKREMQAVLVTEERIHEFYDYSDREDIWIDFVADLGSGWDSTYSVSYLLGRKKLAAADGKGIQHDLPRGNILIMGGDEVYPTATWQAYNDKLVGPYRCSLPFVSESDAPPNLFAIPGNHDWYDGLSSFIKLFCQKRWIGGWKTMQSRSYFSIKLPDNWWVWGIDIQLSTDIDKPQLDYFDHAFKEAKDGDSIILCTAEPVWVYQEYERDNKPYKNLEFFQQRYAGKEGKKINFRLVLTGDLHHFTSFQKTDDDTPDWKITAGGGGAFSHPTHQIPDTLHLKEGKYEKKAAFPTSGQSRKMAWKNLRFPLINKSFGAFFAVIYLLFTWFAGSEHWGDSSFLASQSTKSFWGGNGAFIEFGKFLGMHPGFCFFLGVIFIGIVGFADKKLKNPTWGWITGVLHGLVQVFLLIFAVWLTAWLVINIWGFSPLSIIGVVLIAVVIALLGWLLSGGAMGLYLLIVNLVFNMHQTEAFSSFRGADYKNFLRMHLSRDGLRIFPIKIPKACQNWKYNPGVEGENPWYEPVNPLDYSLIQDPIDIKRK